MEAPGTDCAVSSSPRRVALELTITPRGDSPRDMEATALQPPPLPYVPWLPPANCTLVRYEPSAHLKEAPTEPPTSLQGPQLRGHELDPTGARRPLWSIPSHRGQLLFALSELCLLMAARVLPAEG